MFPLAVDVPHAAVIKRFAVWIFIRKNTITKNGRHHESPRSTGPNNISLRRIDDGKRFVGRIQN